MRNKVAKRLRDLSGWYPHDGKWIRAEAPPEATPGQRFYNKNPAYVAYKMLKKKYKTLGTPLYTEDKGKPKTV